MLVTYPGLVTIGQDYEAQTINLLSRAGLSTYQKHDLLRRT
jgi:hypothetical protein